MKVSTYKQPIDYAKALCNTMMKKDKPEDLYPKGRFYYQPGVFLSGMYATYQLCGDEKYYRYVKTWVDSIIDPEGQISSYTGEELDDAMAGILLYPLLDRTGDERYRKALDILIKMIKEFPRNKEGGFWHMLKYPNQMWLDGLYMAGPICAEYGARFGEPQLWEECAHQALLMREKTEDKGTGLWYHAWDSSGKAVWANTPNQCSREFWGRSIGWVPVGILNELDFIPEDYEKRPQLEALVRDLLQAVCRYQSEDGRWYQVVNKGYAPENWLETSCSCLFTAGICKAVRKGILDKSFLEQARNGYEAVIRSLDYDGEDIFINNISFGTGPGQYQYYIDRMRRTNDYHGVGTFLIMCSEVQQTFYPV